MILTRSLKKKFHHSTRWRCGRIDALDAPAGLLRVGKNSLWGWSGNWNLVAPWCVSLSCFQHLCVSAHLHLRFLCPLLPSCKARPPTLSADELPLVFTLHFSLLGPLTLSSVPRRRLCVRPVVGTGGRGTRKMASMPIRPVSSLTRGRASSPS